MAITKEKLAKARQRFLNAYHAFDNMCENYIKEQVKANGNIFVFDFREKISGCVDKFSPQTPKEDYDNIAHNYLNDMGYYTTWYDRHMFGHYSLILGIRAEKKSVVRTYVILDSDGETEEIDINDLDAIDIWSALIDFITDGEATFKEWLTQSENI